MTSERVPSLRLPPKKELACRLIAEGATQTHAAAHPQVNVTKQTLTKWAKDPNFRSRIEELRTDLELQAQEIIKGGIVDAAEAVVRIAAGNVKVKVIENGEELEVDADSRVLGARLKAALWILESVQQKKLPKLNSSSKQTAAAQAELADPADAREWLDR